MAGAFRELYINHAPRWIKCIKWQDKKEAFIYSQKQWLLIFWVPAIIYFYALDSAHGAEWIALKRPKNKEELLQIKRDYFRHNPYLRDYDIDQYWNNRQPLYDMAIRRQKYSEHYGTKYDGYKRWF